MLDFQRALGGDWLPGALPPAADAPPDAMPPDLFGSLPDPSQDTTLSPYERVEALIPEDSPLHGMDSLDEVFAWLGDTVLTPIDEDRINPVLGVGPRDADLMVIGEAPGADEDKTGEPFVGRAGQLLNKILEAVGFQRDEVYITNILKSRPPGNRDPARGRGRGPHPDPLQADRARPPPRGSSPSASRPGTGSSGGPRRWPRSGAPSTTSTASR